VDAPSTSLSLLDRARQRNQQAWARLVFLYGPLVDCWCRGWGIQGSDADDLKQEVFQAVSTALATFRCDRPGDTFRGWLRVIAHRKFLDQCRKKQRQPDAVGGSAAQRQLLAVPEPQEAPANDPPEEVKRLHHRALEIVRGEFEVKTWQAFWRCGVEGNSPVDVGREMGMTPAAVRKAKSRVLRRLKEELGDLLG
jgi:RNA polymerase sigma-70 factor, ECF subfamily